MIGILGKSATLPLEVPVGQEVEKVTWSSRGLVAILRPGPAGEPILVAGTQGPYSQRLSIPRHNYSLQISSLRLQDSGPLDNSAVSPSQHHQGFHPVCLW